jgi:DNA replication and repair protein RecF
MYVARLEATDFRSYASLRVDFEPGANLLLGPNGAGKTNVVEAIAYAATLTSHRVGGDTPLVRRDAARAVLHLDLVHGSRRVILGLDIGAGNTAAGSINGVAQRRRRDLAGVLRAVVFAPEDLALVKGDPEGRRRFLDGLLVQQGAHWAGELADYDRIARQRASLLKTLGAARGSGRAGALETLEVWDSRLADYGARIAVGRARLAAALAPPAARVYASLAGSGQVVTAEYAMAVDTAGSPPTNRPPDNLLDDDGQASEALAARLRAVMAGLRDREIERGVNLVGPHRDDLVLSIGGLPARGYASHGESWSLALALKMAAFEVLGDGPGGSPVLVLDDVFAELDPTRRLGVVQLVAGAEQVFLTAAAAADVPPELAPTLFQVADGEVKRAG